MQQLYSFDLMKDSGSISGYLVTPQQSEHIDRTLSSLANIDWMEENTASPTRASWSMQ